ncbi:MAG: glycosyl transferase, partial [Chloroflexi bacterium]|nr:glycosyl transferase [Chloroflexota bacterium]
MIDAPNSLTIGAPPAPTPAAETPPPPRHAPRRLAHALEAALLLAIVGVNAALELVNLQAEAFGNTYYAAAVQSMLASWHNFFFVSSDLGGFVSVDKPP